MTFISPRVEVDYVCLYLVVVIPLLFESLKSEGKKLFKRGILEALKLTILAFFATKIG